MTHLGKSSHVGFALNGRLSCSAHGRILRVDPNNPKHPDRDRFTLSKGHAGAGVYAALAERGFFSIDLQQHYQNGSIFSGHVSHKGIPGLSFLLGHLDMD